MDVMETLTRTCTKCGKIFECEADKVKDRDYWPCPDCRTAQRMKDGYFEKHLLASPEGLESFFVKEDQKMTIANEIILVKPVPKPVKKKKRKSKKKKKVIVD